MENHGPRHAFSSVRSIYTILLAHMGKAVSFMVCATRKLRQPLSHCLELLFLSCVAPVAKSFLYPARPSEGGTQGHLGGSARSGLGVAPAAPGGLEPDVTGVSDLK